MFHDLPLPEVGDDSGNTTERAILEEVERRTGVAYAGVADVEDDPVRGIRVDPWRVFVVFPSDEKSSAQRTYYVKKLGG